MSRSGNQNCQNVFQNALTPQMAPKACVLTNQTRWPIRE